MGNIELHYLLLSSAFALVMWIPYVLNRVMVRGIPDTMGYPAAPKPLADWAERLKKSHYNHIENLLPFAAIVLVGQALGISTAASTTCAATFFYSRVVYTRHEMRLAPQLSTLNSQHIPISTVGGLIFDADDRVLMIRTHKWSDLWGIPGGKIKWGERSEDALRRELKEETNLDITDIRFVLVQDCIHSKEFYRDAHFLLLNYTCRAAGSAPPVTLNDEAQAFRWVTLAEALTMDLNRPTRVLLDEIMK